MSRRLLNLSMVLLIAGAAGACSATTDLSQTCKMTRPSPTAGQPPVELEAAKVANAAFDYVSFGAAECDDLVCVRTAGSPNPDNEIGMARGYCTAPCIDSSDCSPDYQGKKGTLRCEQILPDLAQLQQDDPQGFQQTFGSGTAQRYCVRPRAGQ